jgi:pimeloyl-ACP methyl ester carboxylesterase
MNPTHVDALAAARLAAREVRVVATATGERIAARIVGRGEAVVLVHGVTDNLGTWHAVQHALRGEFATHAVDLPGHGLSDIPSSPLRLRHQAESVLGYLDAIGIERCTVVGNSMGGGVALALAHLAPRRVKSLVLLCSLGTDFPAPFGLSLLRYRAIAARMPSIARNVPLRRVLLGGSFAPGFVADEAVQERYWNAWKLAARVPYTSALLRSIDVAEPWEWLPHLRLPVHVVHGAKDRVIPVRVGHAIASRIPNARTTVLAAVGHMPQIEVPARVAEFVRDAVVT